MRNTTRVLRNYHSGLDKPYRNVLHDHLDRRSARGDECLLPSRLFDGIPDGAVVRITVEDTGERIEGKWRLAASGEYQFVPSGEWTDFEKKHKQAQYHAASASSS